MTPSRLTDALVEQWLQPDWPQATDAVRQRVRAWLTTRAGNLSRPPFHGFNTANHVGDDPVQVQANRHALAQHFHWQTEPQWLKQVHGIDVVDAAADGVEREGDAVFTRRTGQICTLHTADCLPAFFTTLQGDCVALAHAGWRGLAAGVLEQTVARMETSPDQIQVWLGPAIGPDAFEVGGEVRSAFTAIHPEASACFRPNDQGRWQADLYGLARLHLGKAGVHHISGGEFCTFNDPRFFSFRREPVTGRLLSLIWLAPDNPAAA